ncbi:hypothetical protein OE88DRAFT_1730527 [Heliocybe sulcata]|uniref:Uncharacterized protein n=1 Tax=Heliocybe sulcata TaxID=5364 RepID=A0A5C3NI97_9AGAM|nr:hypothetical protein OE88DRAFT_1730527 [Heliocybe sulcata]
MPPSSSSVSSSSSSARPSESAGSSAPYVSSSESPSGSPSTSRASSAGSTTAASTTAVSTTAISSASPSTSARSVSEASDSASPSRTSSFSSVPSSSARASSAAYGEISAGQYVASSTTSQAKAIPSSLPASTSTSASSSVTSSRASAHAKVSPSTSHSGALNGGPIAAQSSVDPISETTTYHVVTTYATVVESNSVYVTITTTNSQASQTPFAASGNESVSSRPSDFLSHSGAVAGVFLAVGIVLAILASLLICVLRRRRKEKQVAAPLPDPFSDPPPMRAVLVSRTDARWDRPYTFHSDDGHNEKDGLQYDRDEFSVPVLQSAEGPTNNRPVTSPPMYEGPFSDYHAVERQATTAPAQYEAKRDSFAPSSPSLYPLSEEGSDDISEYHQPAPLTQPKIEPPVAALNIKREGVQEVVRNYRPLTPPSSSHGLSDSEQSAHMSEKQSIASAGSLLINRNMDHYNPDTHFRPKRNSRRLT